jgi:putative Ca2+/H+ antiporter (TMEM165/GDT1 family)
MPELSIVLSTFALIALAEMGDKSQLVCMTLAMRHRHWPVIVGASAAFVVLNVLAVLFGAGVAAWIPDRIVATVVALLFAGFGIHALYTSGEVEDEAFAEISGRSIVITTALLIFAAEFGDKTQLAVAGLASSLNPWGVWLGATLALVVTTALGVWAGRTLLQRFPVQWLQRAGGVAFLGFAGFAAWKAYGL